MATMTCECGDSKCEVIHEEAMTRCYWWQGNHYTASFYSNGVAGPICETTFCTSCGARLGFAPDGTPTVGPSYADLQSDALRFRKLATSDCGYVFGNGKPSYRGGKLMGFKVDLPKGIEFDGAEDAVASLTRVVDALPENATDECISE